MTQLGAFVLGNTALALAGAVLVLVVQRALRPRPATTSALWALVLLQLCWPWQWRWTLPLLPAAPSSVAVVDGAQRRPAPAAALADQVVPTALRAPDAVLASMGPTAPPAAEATATAPAVAPAAAPVAAHAGFDVAAILPWIWSGTALAVLLGAVVLILRGRRAVLCAAPAPAWLRDEIARLARQLGVRAPAFADDPRVRSPFVWAFGRPRIVGSSAALAALPAPARAAVLAHELAHLRRRDHLWLWLEVALTAVWFWHPLFWFLRARMREQAELACDAWALWAVPGARLRYARALVDALETVPTTPAVPVLAARPGARRLFERRLSMILQNPVPCRASRWAVPGVLALGLGLCVTPVQAQGQGESERPKVEIRVDGVKLEDMSRSQRERLLRDLGLEGEALRLALRARSVDGEAQGGGEAADERRAGLTLRRDDRGDRSDDRGDDVRIQLQLDDLDLGKLDLGHLDLGHLDLGDLGVTLRGALGGALGEAMDEVRNDPDLRELGIADEVEGLLGTLQRGGDFGGSLERLIDQAIVGAGRMAARELQADDDLRELGIADDLGRLVTGLVQSEDVRQGLSQLAHKAMRTALQSARVEIQGDGDLRELGLTDDVLRLLDGVEDGKLDLDGLQPMIRKAVQGALRAASEATGEATGETADDDADQDRARRGRDERRRK
ncbi:MAG: M56 family metallopeptidase [Planctomycetota bacterium]